MNPRCEDKPLIKNPNKIPLNEIVLDYQEISRSKGNTLLNETLNMLKIFDISSGHCNIKTIKISALDKCWIDRKCYGRYHKYDFYLTEEQNKLFIQNRIFLHNLQFLNECSFHQFWCYISHEPSIILFTKQFLYNALPLSLLRHLSRRIYNLHVEIHFYIYRLYRRLLQYNVSEFEYIREDIARSIIKETGLLSIDLIFILCYLYNLEQPHFVSQVMTFCLKEKDNFLKSVSEILKKIANELDNFTTTYHTSAYEENIFFLFELGSTVRQFLSACEQAIDIAFNIELPSRFAYVYQILNLQTEGRSKVFDELIRNVLAFGKFEFVNIYHIFTTHCLNAMDCFRNDIKKQDEHLERYVGLISNALDSEIFVTTYDKTYSIHKQFETLITYTSNFDTHQSQYLLKSLDTIVLQFSRLPEFDTTVTSASKTSKPIFDVKKYNSLYETLALYLDRPMPRKCSKLPKHISVAVEEYYQLMKENDDQNRCKLNYEGIDAAVMAILEVFPHLDEHFIIHCLNETNYDVNEVITRILSECLSDAFDSPSSSKTEEYSNINETINDKKEKESIKQFIFKASCAIDLDDEYDDRIDNNNMLDSDEESRIYRHLEYDHTTENENSSDDEKRTDLQNKKLDFCVDPALIREMRSQRSSHAKNTISKKNLEQGDKKNVKSSKSKHNRKGMAHYKRKNSIIPL